MNAVVKVYDFIPIPQTTGSYGVEFSSTIPCKMFWYEMLKSFKKQMNLKTSESPWLNVREMTHTKWFPIIFRDLVCFSCIISVEQQKILHTYFCKRRPTWKTRTKDQSYVIGLILWGKNNKVSNLEWFVSNFDSCHGRPHEKRCGHSSEASSRVGHYWAHSWYKVNQVRSLP